ncbi:4Fe-4S binding protein [Bythopirellula polymerisocia]|nr:4Fe-4S binding protein [Bythopirellula polymerisocia]
MRTQSDPILVSMRSGLSAWAQGCGLLTLLFLMLATVMLPVRGQEEYSRPVTAAPQPEDIGDSYQLPAVQHVAPRSTWWYAVDVVLLFAALVAAALVAHRWRRRWMVVTITVASLAYFGFFRQGCVCPIGAIQNVAAAIADPTLAVPFVVVLFFLLPLIAALLVGRVFCSGVCPLGAIQDLAVLWPVQLPRAVDRWGGMLKYLYLAAALWFAVQPAGERDFIICRFDPFVGFFRLSGSAWMLLLGGGLLVLGMFVGRPYCRFLCPYGGLLAIVSRYALKSVCITPDEELDCGLCAESCPFGAIRNLRADRADCMACARCFAHCPRQQVKWGEIELVEIENTKPIQLRTPLAPVEAKT